MEHDLGTLGDELAPHDCTLARYDMSRAVVVDVGFEIETKYFSRTERAGSQPIGADAALVFLCVTVISQCLTKSDV